jgi:hypothetical protein
MTKKHIIFIHFPRIYKYIQLVHSKVYILIVYTFFKGLKLPF